jgi:hypothetical protein
MIFGYILILLTGILIGGIVNKWSSILSFKNEEKRLILDKNKQFKQILDKVLNKKTIFKTRVNNTVYIWVKLDDYGKVDILYFLDKRDIAIFKGDSCIMTSKDVKSDLLNDVINNIDRVHYHRIIDIVEVLGFIFYREDFEKNFNINVKELKERANMIKSLNETSDIQNIINKNNDKFDIDEILDKINQVGIENLTKEEKDFLNNYNQK